MTDESTRDRRRVIAERLVRRVAELNGTDVPEIPVAQDITETVASAASTKHEVVVVDLAQATRNIELLDQPLPGFTGGPSDTAQLHDYGQYVKGMPSFDILRMGIANMDAIQAKTRDFGQNAPFAKYVSPAHGTYAIRYSDDVYEHTIRQPEYVIRDGLTLFEYDENGVLHKLNDGGSELVLRTADGSFRVLGVRSANVNDDTGEHP